VSPARIELGYRNTYDMEYICQWLINGTFLMRGV